MLAAHPYLKLKVASSPKGKNSDVEPKVHVNQAHKIERYVLLARVSCEYNIYKVDDVESLHCHSSSRPKADCQLQIEMLHISSVKRGTNWFADSLAHRKEKIARCRVGQILFTEGMWYVGRANLAAPVACRSCTKLDLEQPRCRVFYYVQAPHNSQAQRFGEIQCTEDYWHSISPFCNVVGFEKLEALYNTIWFGRHWWWHLIILAAVTGDRFRWHNRKPGVTYADFLTNGEETGVELMEELGLCNAPSIILAIWYPYTYVVMYCTRRNVIVWDCCWSPFRRSATQSCRSLIIHSYTPWRGTKIDTNSPE